MAAWRLGDAWIVAGFAALGLGLRLACINQSLFGDELFLYLDVHDRSLGQVLSVVHDTEKTPPLGFILGWLFARGGSATELVRLPSLFASVATVPLIYLLGLRTIGRGAALVAAAWFALSPFEIFYGTETRSYALVAALVVLSTLSLLAALDEGRRRWWALYALASLAALYTHYIAALVLVPQAAWALWTQRESLRELLLANALVALAFVPWLPSLVVQVRHSAAEAKYLSYAAPLTLSRLAQIEAKSLVGHPFDSLRRLPGLLPLIALAGLLLGLLVALALEARHRRWARGSRGGLLVLLALAPLVGLALYSLRPNTSFLLARNLSVAVPYALLLLGWLLTFPRPRAAAALSTVALAAVGVGTVKVLGPDYQRPDGRDAAEYIDAHAPPRAPVVDVQTITPFDQSPARATRLYLAHEHRVYPFSEWQSAWAAAARTRSQLVVSYPRAPGLSRVVAPPRRYAGQYRLAGKHASRGTPYGLVVREYAPR